MIQEIPNDQTTLNALERLRLALGGLTDTSGACVVISLGATRINRLTEEKDKLLNTIKDLQKKKTSLIQQQNRIFRDRMDHLDYPDDDER